VVAERRWSTQDPGWMVALTLMSSTFSLFLMTSGESETTRQQRYRACPVVPRSCAGLEKAYGRPEAVKCPRCRAVTRCLGG